MFLNYTLSITSDIIYTSTPTHEIEFNLILVYGRQD
jgi:hypothetical protein